MDEVMEHFIELVNHGDFANMTAEEMDNYTSLAINLAPQFVATIAQQQAEIGRLREALLHMVDSGDEYTSWKWFVDLARAALKGGE